MSQVKIDPIQLGGQELLGCEGVGIKIVKW